MATLPPPPTAAQIDFVWLVQNKETLAAYMAAVYALQNLQAIVIAAGVRQPSTSVSLAGPAATIEIKVP
ncbi:MAG: hypothetical protein H7343_12265 [Undibacterium sp.]|nr:hypothetical protein [Opitutaceae bacterium]